MAYETPLFNKLSKDKQTQILKFAGIEFARSGYASGNINVIAEKIGISVGSLYKYSGTKENLFLSTVINSCKDLEKDLEENSRLPLDFSGKIENLIGVIQDYTQKNPSSIRLYGELTSVKNDSLAKRLSNEMERIAADYYTRLIEEAQKNGVIRILQRPIEIPENPQSCGAAGAALVAAVGMNIWPDFHNAVRYIKICQRFEPDPEATPFYDRNYRVFKTLHANNKKSFSMLNSHRL